MMQQKEVTIQRVNLTRTWPNDLTWSIFLLKLPRGIFSCGYVLLSLFFSPLSLPAATERKARRDNLNEKWTGMKIRKKFPEMIRYYYNNQVILHQFTVPVWRFYLVKVFTLASVDNFHLCAFLSRVFPHLLHPKSSKMNAIMIFDDIWWNQHYDHFTFECEINLRRFISFSWFVSSKIFFFSQLLNFIHFSSIFWFYFLANNQENTFKITKGNSWTTFDH